jgi:hypothetical protein
VLIATCVAVPLARADGDPASDYLITQQDFLPLSVSYSTSIGGQLTDLLNDSKLKNFPLKVAVIARPDDLGSVPSLFGTPEQYASFLGQEDYYFFKDELLVVMPQGYGLYKASGVPAGDKRVLAKLAPPHVTSGDGLIEAAERAVRALAARRDLTLAAKPVSKSTASQDRIEIIAGVLVLCALAIGVRMLIRRR